jgi:hypothetical protein
MEENLEDEITELFSKHFNRVKKDLSQITGVTPLMIMVVSSAFRNLEDDVKDVLEKNNGLDEDSYNDNI